MKNKYMDELLNDNKYTYYAHTKKENSDNESSNERELLLSHLDLTYKYYKKMERYKKLDIKIKNMIIKIFNVDEEVSKLIYDLFKGAIYYHDIGKINPLFQKEKMNNDIGLENEYRDSTHAAISARIYIENMIKMFKDMRLNSKDAIVVYYVVFYFGYIISRHHTKLESISELQNAMINKNIPQIDDCKDEFYDKYLTRIGDFIDRIKPDSVGIYILCKLLYSCIVEADFYATYEYMTGEVAKIDIEKDTELFQKYTSSNIYKTIREYEKNNIELQGINKLRSDIFLETEKNLIKNINNDIFYLEAPTGAGKTNMAINIARILYENNEDIKSIQYIFPFNSIIEQTSATFDKYFEQYKEFMVINSVSSMIKDDNEKLDYEKVYMQNVFRQFPIVITSHVNLFNTLFGNGKEQNYSLYHLIDSVIVIDEIQAYSNNIWREIIEMLSKYASLLNIKFIIMSATLPRLDQLLKKTLKNEDGKLDKLVTKFFPLVENTNTYYQNKIFKNRVNINFDLLKNRIDKETLISEILKHKKKKVLVEFIKKDTADEMYKELYYLHDNVQILTGDDNKMRRNEVIDLAKEDKPIIIVATQTIEAGVDIDMDIGFKNISFLDGEEQFLGRINRSSQKKGCIAYFFEMDEARKIYKGDNRVEYNLKKEKVRNWLIEKNFKEYYEKVMEKIYDKTEQYNNDNIKNFYSECEFINFEAINRKMTLIDKNKEIIQVFLNYTLKYNGKEIKGEDIFDEYKELCKNDKIGYAEKKVKLSQISQKLNLFVYNIYMNKTNIIEGELFGDIYYVEDGEKYIENGRFNKKKYLGKGEDLFL